jgi:hypothetical protein
MVSDDGRWLFSCSQRELKIVPMSGAGDGQSSRLAFSIPGPPRDMAYHDDSERLALAFGSQPTRVWDLSQAGREMGPELVDNPCDKIWFVSDGKSLLSFSYGFEGRLTRVRVDFLDPEYLSEKSRSIAMRRLSEEEQDLFRLNSTTVDSLGGDESPKAAKIAEVDADGFSGWMNDDSFRHYFQTMRSRKMRPLELEGRSRKRINEYRVKFVFNSSGLSWFARRGISDQSYEEFQNQYLAQGFDEIWHQTFIDHNGKTIHSAIWEKTRLDTQVSDNKTGSSSAVRKTASEEKDAYDSQR